MSGRLNGRYELGEVLGYGGMSEVRAARDTLLNRDVAIKILRKDLARNHNFLERFRREARNSARLNHPNIVAIYDTGESATDDGILAYIVMERLNGRTLRNLVGTEGPLPIKNALKISAQVANALDYSHQMGIVHRDIKPANIMITLTGVPKVMDFGISRAADDMKSLTQASTVFGTAQYISPEHAMGKTIDYRADIYSLGCVLYECLTGQPPFQAETAVAVACKHVQDTPKPPSIVRPEISPALDAVVLKALEKQPENRFDNAGDFQEALEDILGEHVAPRVHLPDYQKMGATLAADTNPTESFTASTSILPIQPLKKHGAADGADGTADGTAGGAANAAGATGASSATRIPASVAGGYAAGGIDNAEDAENVEDAEDTEERGRGAAIKDWWESLGEKKRRTVLISLASVIVVILAGTGTYYGVHDNNSDTVVTAGAKLQNYHDQDAHSVYDSLTSDGYTVTVVVSDVPTQMHGTIVRTKPEAGTELKKDERITLYVATGNSPIEVPDVSGMSVSKARTMLRLTGIRVDADTVQKPSPHDKKGKVIGTSVPAGDTITPGRNIQLYVGSGRVPVQLPAVVGEDVTTAKNKLTALGLKVQVQTMKSAKPRGTVISVQNAGEDLSEGDAVTLVVSDGSLITMPNLVGDTSASAVEKLRAAGWSGQLNRSHTNTLDIRRIGRVAKQYPVAGAEVDKDSAVSITVYELNLP